MARKPKSKTGPAKPRPAKPARPQGTAAAARSPVLRKATRAPAGSPTPDRAKEKKTPMPAWGQTRLSTGGTLGALSAKETVLLVFLRHSG